MQDDENVKRLKSIERAVVVNDKVLICESWPRAIVFSPLSKLHCVIKL